MRCQRCGFIGESQRGVCPRCGNAHLTVFPNSLTLQPLKNEVPTRTSSADHIAPTAVGLHKGRYRLLESVTLPANQQDQGRAWIALDARSSRQRVLLREILFDAQVDGSREQIVKRIAGNFAQLAQQNPGFPAVVETFMAQDTHYIALQIPAGESLATLMKRQGGALPEREVAIYGRQICEMLKLLLSLPVPIVHGAISPDTILVDQARQQVSLLYVPLFPPKVLPKEKTQSAYVAPEQLRGDLLPASDIYALAATMHHAVTGFDPRDRLANFYPPARRLNPTISQDTETILANGLRLSVSQRTASPVQMQRELTQLIQTLPQVTPLPQTPVTPVPGSIGSGERRGGWLRNLMIALASALIIVLIALLALPRLFNPPQPQVSAGPSPQTIFNQQLATELRAYQQKGIGVSDGRLAFDVYPGRADTFLKKQAATALQQNNTSAAVNALNQAVNNDPTDGEAQIYNENIHILQNKSPYVTIAVGLPIDGSDAYLGVAREELEAIYLAQHQANSKNVLPNGQKLRILLANSGSNNADVATVAQFLADRVLKAGNLDHLVGLVGWYTSTQTINARDIIAGAHLPIVAATASSVKLSSSSPYFFRLCPSDAIQGQALGKLLINDLKVKRVLILRDTTDAYSVSLADAVAGRVQSLGGSFAQGTFTIDKTTTEQYQQIVQDYIKSDPTADTIFLAGFNTDGVRLAHAVGNLARANPNSLQLARFRIVGGDALDSTLLLGVGNNEDSATARNFPDDMRRMIFSTFADFNEWNFQNIPPDKQPPFFADWVSTYQSSPMGNNVLTPQYNGLMIYDAVDIYVQAAKLVKGPSITGEGVRSVLNSLGKGSVPAFQGIAGRVVFDGRGDPVDKALVILTVQEGKKGNEIGIKSIAGTFQ